MRVILSPIASNTDTQVSVSGLVITVDGTDYDFSVIPEGGDAEPGEGEPFIGTLTRDQVTVQYHYDSTTAEPNQSTDWADYTFDITSGEVPDPIARKQPEPDFVFAPQIEPDPESEITESEVPDAD
jgi:hypothetical protein